MSRPLVIEGVTYLRSRDAARSVDLNPDYVTRLARRGLITGMQSEGTWFVNLASLQEFTVHQNYRNAARRRALATERREEHCRARSLAEPVAASGYTALRPNIIARFEQALAREAHSTVQIVGGGPPYVISPTLDLLHKLTALVAALVLVVGTYAVVRADIRTPGRPSLAATAAAAFAVPRTFERAFLDLLHDLSFHQL